MVETRPNRKRGFDKCATLMRPKISEHVHMRFKAVIYLYHFFGFFIKYLTKPGITVLSYS